MPTLDPAALEKMALNAFPVFAVEGDRITVSDVSEVSDVSVPVTGDPPSPGAITTVAPTEVLPHRAPFLFVDRIFRVDDGRRVLGMKRVLPSARKAPGEPRDAFYPMTEAPMLLIEMLAQVGAAGILAQHPRGFLPLFTGIETARFERAVEAGDLLLACVTLERSRGSIGRASGIVVAWGKGSLCSATFSYALVPAPHWPANGDGIS